MTATLTRPTPTPIPAATPGDVASRGTVREWMSDVGALVKRNLIHIAREPMQLSDVTIQPVMFTILFVYIFGSAMVLPGGGSYHDFAIGGLVAMNLTTSSMGTAIGLTNDLSTGVMDRFRTLPMARSAVLMGRSLSDLLASALCGLIVVLTGLAIGFRPDHGVVGVLAGLAVAVAFAHAVSWAMACIGLLFEDAETSGAVAMLFLFPLSFLSTAFVPSQGLPTVLRTIADWNPVSAVAGACRELFGSPNPAKAVDVWPAQHPVAMTLLWAAVILAIAVPLASHLLRKRTTD